jgi:hypothetical protein
MKPQRSRSRSKNNRNRSNNNNASGGNVMNRVFDSSGPEGKVRGTPQQIIEMEVRREEQERQNRERQIERDREREERLARQEQQAASQPKPVEQAEVAADPSDAPQPDVMETGAESGLVETPETQPKLKQRQRRKPRPKPVEQGTDQVPSTDAQAPVSEAPDAAE